MASHYRKKWSDTPTWSARSRDTQPEGFWASYSDLMAGILMIFVLVYMVARNATLESAKAFGQFTKAMNEICASLKPYIDRNDDIKMDCDTGAIEFVTGLYGFNETKLTPAFEADLRAIVPRWLEALAEPGISDQVEYIEIGGHADKYIAAGGDPDMGNVEVSEDRARKVLEFLLLDSELEDHHQRLRDQGVVVGYSTSDFPDTCEEDECPEARRIVMKANVNEAAVLVQLIETIRRQQ